MNLTIGTKIRALRKARGITQEELAKAIGISFQAVSKWENNIALPDISLVPAIAGYFGVTIDELFDFNLREINENVKKICDEACQYRESDPVKSRAILENGLKKYPQNDIILNNMLYVMNYSEDPDATIAIAGKLAGSTDDPEVKYDALRFLAYAYDVKGEYESARSAIEQIPEIYFTKLTELAFALKGAEKFEPANKQKWISFENLLQMMAKIAEAYEADGKPELAVHELRRARKLIDVMEDDNFANYADYFEKVIARLEG